MNTDPSTDRTGDPCGRVEPVQGTEETLRQLVAARTAELELLNQKLSAEVAERLRAQELLQQAHDTLERRVAERTAELAKTTEMLQALLEAAPVAVLVIDPAGNVLLWNHTAERIFGWTSAEVVGRPLPIVPPERQAEFRGLVARVLKGESLVNVELRRRRKDGSDIDASLSTATLRDATGAIIGIVAMIADITERKQAELDRERLTQQLYQAQKMEAVGQLAGGVAHDFNNLLQVIAGYTDLAMSELSPQHPHYALLEQITAAARRATSLVRQLLVFSRQQAMERRSVDLNETIHNLLRLLHRLLGEHVVLRFQPAEKNLRIFADPGQIEQVLMNLCVNSRDAMPHGGTITIETRRVTVDADYCETHPWAREGEYALLMVTDDGPGIPPDLQERVFEPFFTTKEVGKGTGLGLATVYGIVKQHGGMIHLYSEPGSGASFKIYLPVSADTEPQADAPAGNTDAMAGRGETILLAEDEEFVCNLAIRILERAGYRVVAARDGQEAIEIFERSPDAFDLALLDVVMPHASGRRVYERIKALRPDLPVLFSSGYSRNLLTAEFVPDAQFELVHKPYSSAALLEKIRALLGDRA